MEKRSPSSSGPRELQCIGKLEIASPTPVGFLCGSIPVPTDKAFHYFNSALIPSATEERAPMYRMIPTETDLNMPPLISSIPEKVLPIAAVKSRTTGDIPWESGAITSNLTRKGEALAVSGLVDYGDEIDVIAPADILKQIFKIPYSKARLSIAVHRVGQTLVLNTGPDVEEGEKLVRRHNNPPECVDQSLFLNFAMHSVRMEACDCPPPHHASAEEQSKSSVLPGPFDSREAPHESSDHPAQRHASQFFDHDDDSQEERFSHPENLFYGKKKSKKNKGRDALKRASQVKEKPRCSVQESENHQRVSSDGFLRVLFWQFHNFRVLLGSDLLIFSNEKYVAVSLHLWDVSRQVTPLTWLEAWLDNVMASVPELAICYHQNGVVQGYELLKTDDIFLLKGISEDGTPAFHPHVVQQNGLSVLRFLQENCKQDPGAYWLHKSAGEDVIQLFNLSVMSKNHSSGDCDDSSSSLPTLIHRRRSDSLLSLGMLLYRIAHKLSLSMSPNNRARCARFFKKCFDFLDERDHLVVRVFAHEQFARLLLNYDEELDLTCEWLPLESEVTLVDAEEESFENFSGISRSVVHEIEHSPVVHHKAGKDSEPFQDYGSEVSVMKTLVDNVTLIESGETESESGNKGDTQSSSDQRFAVCETSTTHAHVVETIADPISSKLAAIHHVSQAIKSLRLKRQLQSTEMELDHVTKRSRDRSSSSMDFSICACGDADCIEICDIREWLPTSRLDDKSWKLILLLGESYLALGQAYKDDCQFHQALKVVDLACLVYGSMPQHLEDTQFISSMVCSSPMPVEINGRSNKGRSDMGGGTKVHSSENDDCLTFDRFSFPYLFWAKAWTLVGDVYVELHVIKGKEISNPSKGKSSTRELRMSSEVLKEVERLKKKLGPLNQNCSSCSLINCSCQSDRASSGSSASSSTRGTRSLGYGKKHTRKLHAKSTTYSHFGNTEDDHVDHKGGNGNYSDNRYLKHNKKETLNEVSDKRTEFVEEDTLAATDSIVIEDTSEIHNAGSTADVPAETGSTGPTKVKNGGIFKYLRGPVFGDADDNLSAALSCYEEARKALGEHPTVSAELLSVFKKKGWVCNELGRNRLERKELDKAELAFDDAIKSFKEVADHTNIILIYCNLGHGRRALAEEMVSEIESLKKHAIFHNAYDRALENAKLEYSESLRYYGAAKTQLNSIADEAGSVSSSLRDEVWTQFAHTYLRLGMLLAREDTVAEVYENRVLEDCTSPTISSAKKELRKHEISANDAIREALSIYESMGELRKQEVAYAYFQLGCFQRDCCLKVLESDQKKTNRHKSENNALQRVKQYASLAERNWQKSSDFYGPKTYPMMCLTILIERSALSLSLSSYFNLNMMLESALTRLLEGRHVSDNTTSDSLSNENPEIYTKFWSQLQMTLKRMVAMTLPTNTNKSSVSSQQIPSNRYADVGKLRELYRMSLMFTDFCQLHTMHKLWTS